MDFRWNKRAKDTGIDLWGVDEEVKKNSKYLYVYTSILVVLVGVVVYLAISIFTSYRDSENMVIAVRESLEAAKPEVIREESKDKDIEDVYPFVSVDLTDLKARNSDVVGWLKVGSANLELPLVQTIDNEFYLSHDIDKKDNKTGWVFVDTGSNINHLGLNTVIYGHNISGHKLFGALKLLLNDSIYESKDAKYIQVTNFETERVFEIVSIYVTTFEDWEYVDTIFKDDGERQVFIDNLKRKNQVETFKTSQVSALDKIITFSTCHGPAGTPNRLVVHAKLVAERAVIK